MNLKRQFFSNVLPSMLAFAFSGIYAIVDGWFVGQQSGDGGLAAINIAYPLTALIQATATGIGMGGAVQISIAIGKGEKQKERKYLGNTLLLLGAACILLTAGLYMIYYPVLKLFGAGGIILQYASEYIRIIILGTVFQIAGTGLIPVVRNYEGAFAAMVSMIAGFVTNVFLDWMFVSILEWGVAGAAAATVVGQAVTMAGTASFLAKKKKVKGFAVWKPEAKLLKNIGKVSVSPFGLTLSPNLVIVIMNKGAAVYGGDAAVACYAVVSYVVCVAQLLLQGIGDGAQPLFSRFKGCGKEREVRKIRTMAYGFSLTVGVFCMISMYILRRKTALFFGVSELVANDVAETLPVFCAGFLFLAFLRVTTSYFYAVRSNVYAYILIYGEIMLIAFLTAAVLPPVLGVRGVWVAVPVADALLVPVGLFLLSREKKGGKSPYQEL